MSSQPPISQFQVLQSGGDPDPNYSVFINCPFDEDFEPLFDAIVFSTICCGFLPRCCLETGTISETRIQRISNAISSSRFSIHDLSRCKGEGKEKIARFNMPLELGMAMSLRCQQKAQISQHDWLALVPSGHIYHHFVSDLSGFDPKKYDEANVGSIIKAVMSWLLTRPGASPSVGPIKVFEAYQSFRQIQIELTIEWGDRNNIPWNNVLQAAFTSAPVLVK